MDGDIVEFLCGGGTFKGCWYGGEKPSDEKGNFWWRKYLRAALRAAPSLTQLEDAIVEAIRFIGVKSGIPATVYGEMCHEVRAKLREQEREGKDG
jgi:hypothetical protein